MFGIILNVTIPLLQMSHFQISKTKGNKVVTLYFTTRKQLGKYTFL